jgi:hypothetical protein
MIQHVCSVAVEANHMPHELAAPTTCTATTAAAAKYTVVSSHKEALPPIHSRQKNLHYVCTSIIIAIHRSHSTPTASAAIYIYDNLSRKVLATCIQH